MSTVATRERLGLGSDLWSMLPIYGGFLVGGLLATAFESNIVRLTGLLIIGASLVVAPIRDFKRALLTVIIVEIPLQLDIFVDHDPLALTNISGFNLSLTTLCLGVLYLLWALEALAGRAEQDQGFLKSVAPALLYFLTVTASLFAAENLVFAVYELNVLAQALLLLVYIWHWARSRSDILFLVVLFSLGIALQSLVAIAQELAGVGFNLGPINGEAADGRATGTLRHGNRLGSFVALLIGPSLGLALARRVSIVYRVIGGVSFSLGLFALLFARSRGALLAAAIGIVLMVALAYRRRWIDRRMLIVGALFVGLIVVTQYDVVSARLERDVLEDPNVIGRFHLIELSLELIRQNPVFGVGANNFGHALPAVITADFAGIWIAPVHNKYFLVWSETGLLGILAYGYFLIALIRGSWNIYMTDRTFGPIGLGLLSGIVALMIHMTFDKFASRVDIHILWMYAGAILATMKVLEREKGQQAHERLAGRPSTR